MATSKPGLKKARQPELMGYVPTTPIEYIPSGQEPLVANRVRQEPTVQPDPEKPAEPNVLMDLSDEDIASFLDRKAIKPIFDHEL